MKALIEYTESLTNPVTDELQTVEVPVTAVNYDLDVRTVAMGGGDGFVRLLPAKGGTGGSTAAGR